jgi:hypothetical protein
MLKLIYKEKKSQNGSDGKTIWNTMTMKAEK